VCRRPSHPRDPAGHLRGRAIPTGVFVAMLTALMFLGGALAASDRVGTGDIGWEARNQSEEEPEPSKPMKEEMPPTLEPLTGSVPPGYSSRIIHVKFREGIRVDAPETLLPVDLRDSVASITRLYSLPEQELENIRRKGEARSGRQLADLNLWFQITLKPDVDAARFSRRA
jgi:hypothetical protein